MPRLFFFIFFKILFIFGEGEEREKERERDIDVGEKHYLVAFHTPPTGAVSYTHLTLPTRYVECRSRWSPYH